MFVDFEKGFTNIFCISNITFLQLVICLHLLKCVIKLYIRNEGDFCEENLNLFISIT